MVAAVTGKGVVDDAMGDALRKKKSKQDKKE